MLELAIFYATVFFTSTFASWYFKVGMCVFVGGGKEPSWMRITGKIHYVSPSFVNASDEIYMLYYIG